MTVLVALLGGLALFLGADSSRGALIASECPTYFLFDSGGSGNKTMSLPGSAFLTQYQTLRPCATFELVQNGFSAPGGLPTLAGALFRLPAGYYKSVEDGKRRLNAFFDSGRGFQCPKRSRPMSRGN